MLQEAGETKGEATTSARITQLHLGRDDTLLAQLGYKPEFRRVFSPIEVFGVGFSIIGLLPSLTSVLVYSIPYGGPVAMVWGWSVCAIFLIIIGLAMAELGSAAPTIGGLYYWTFMFSSPKWRCLLSWIVGYSNTVGNIASVASVDWGCAVQIMAAVSIGSGETFSATTAQTFGLFAALLLCHASLCSLNPKFIARLQTPFIIVNVVLCLVIIIGVPAATPHEFRNSASFAFGNFQNFSGWNNGFAFILSFLAPLWTIGAFDSTVHISEEARNANTAIPFAMITAATTSSIIGWGINVALAFCMGKDLESILASPIGQPMAAILFNSFGQRGTLAFWAWIIIVQFSIGMSMLTTCSRQIFAFSRDGGLPLSFWLYNVNKRTHAPVNAVWFAAGVSLLLGLLAFAGPSAIGAIFSLVVTGQYLAYSIPIAARFIGQKEVKRGPFSLGRLSMPVAATAVTWMVFIIVVFLFPASPNPDKETFNYTIAVWGGTLALAIGYYYLPVYGGIHWFKGPVQTIQDMDVASQTSDEKNSESDKDSVSKEKEAVSS